MKNHVFIIAATLLGAGSALAADLPTHKAPPPMAPAPVFSWTGLYIGVNGGGAWGRTDPFDSVGGPGTAHHDVSGAFVGASIGYNYQFSPNLVAGLEGDVDWADISGKTTCPNAAFTCSTHADMLGSVRGRFGYAIDRLLMFTTGGLGIGDFRYRTYRTATGVDFATPYTTTAVGWVLGAGLEYAITDHVSLKGEYDFYGFPSSTAAAGVLDPGAVKLGTNIQVAKFGVNYKF